MFAGKTFFLTKSVQPPPAELEDIVVAGGGVCVKRMPAHAADDTFVISCAEDRASWANCPVPVRRARARAKARKEKKKKKRKQNKEERKINGGGRGSEVWRMKKWERKNMKKK